MKKITKYEKEVLRTRNQAKRMEQQRKGGRLTKNQRSIDDDPCACGDGGEDGEIWTLIGGDDDIPIIE
jgi:hypothetical protein